MRIYPDLDTSPSLRELAGVGPTADAALAEAAAAGPDELTAALHQAVEVANRHAIDHDAFMRAAWLTLMAARPGLRSELERRALIAQLGALREAGRLGQA